MKCCISLALALCLLAATTLAQGNSFKDIRYQGGTLATTTKADDWGNHLTVTSEATVNCGFTTRAVSNPGPEECGVSTLNSML